MLKVKKTTCKPGQSLNCSDCTLSSITYKKSERKKLKFILKNLSFLTFPTKSYEKYQVMIFELGYELKRVNQLVRRTYFAAYTLIDLKYGRQIILKTKPLSFCKINDR